MRNDGIPAKGVFFKAKVSRAPILGAGLRGIVPAIIYQFSFISYIFFFL